MVAKKGLGRGLDALLGDVEPEKDNSDEGLQHFPLDLMQPGKYQPRIDMAEDSLEELADSIRSQGLVQPIIVRAIDDGRYEIIAGERRWRASKLAGLNTIPTIVRKVSDRSAIAMALIENIQRENLNPMEEANALHRLKEEFALTHQEAAEAVGRSRASVSNLLRLRNLNDDVKRLLENGDLEMGHARALLALEGDHQSKAAHEIVENSLSVRETEQLIRRLSKPEKAKPAIPPQQTQRFSDIEQQIDTKLCGRFSMKYSKNGKGKLIIDFNNANDLQNIVDRIK